MWGGQDPPNPPGLAGGGGRYLHDVALGHFAAGGDADVIPVQLHHGWGGGVEVGVITPPPHGVSLLTPQIPLQQHPSPGTGLVRYW